MRLAALRLQNASTKEPVRFESLKNACPVEFKMILNNEQEQKDLKQHAINRTYSVFQVVQMKQVWCHWLKCGQHEGLPNQLDNQVPMEVYQLIG